jgi:hypothetical protein
MNLCEFIRLLLTSCLTASNHSRDKVRRRLTPKHGTGRTRQAGGTTPILLVRVIKARHGCVRDGEPYHTPAAADQEVPSRPGMKQGEFHA